MAKKLPGGKEARYRLLGLQTIVHDGGVILKRGTTRLFLDGEDIVDLVDVVVEKLAGGRQAALSDLVAAVGVKRSDALEALIAKLQEHRLLVTANSQRQDGDRREEIFFWNYQTTFAEIIGELAEVDLTLFGVNTIGLALLGNLRGCGFRNMTFVDHAALRNADYYDAQGQLRREISGAMSVPPVPFDDWNRDEEKRLACFIVCCDFGGRVLMRDWNRFCVENRVLFYPVALVDHIAHIGPLVRPGEGPCYECLWARENANMANAAFTRAGEAEPDTGYHAVGYLQPMARAAADYAAIDLLKIFSNALPENPLGSLIEIDLLAPRLVTRDLIKVPDCPVCAELSAPADVSEAADVPTPGDGGTDAEAGTSAEDADHAPATEPEAATPGGPVSDTVAAAAKSSAPAAASTAPATSNEPTGTSPSASTKDEVPAATSPGAPEGTARKQASKETEAEGAS